MRYYRTEAGTSLGIITKSDVVDYMVTEIE